MEDYKLILTEDGEHNISETVSVLIDAAGEIAKAQESDFEKIKNKKWYNRLWELVTFSKDNEKIQARGVANLAKLNDIIMKAILLIAKQSAETAENLSAALTEIKNTNENVDVLFDGMSSLTNTILKLKRGVRADKRFDELSDKQQEDVALVYERVVKEVGIHNEFTQNLSQKILTHTYSGTIELTLLDEMVPDVHKVLYGLLQSYFYLATGEFATSDQHDVFAHLGVSAKVADRIKENIKDDITVLGKDGYINMFAVEDEDDYFFTECDIEFEEAENAEEEDSKPRLEDVYISQFLQIQPDEVKLFYYQNVHIQSNIDCHGKLKFYGCNIFYNEEDSIGVITLSPDAKLDAVDCSVYCESISGKPFIQGSSASIYMEKSRFYSCSLLIQVSNSSIYMDKCGVYNCMNGFVKSDDGYSSFVENTIIVLDNDDALIKEKEYCRTHKDYEKSNILEVDRCSYSNNLFYCPSHLTDFPSIGVFGGQYISIEHCSFVSFGNQHMDYVRRANSIAECLFIGGSSIITMDDNNELSESMFINCENAITCSSNIISSCYFVDCYRTTISNSVSGGTIIDSCVFLNTKHIPKPEKRKYFDPSPCIQVSCYISFMGKGYNKPNEIRNCLFHGLTQYENIIAPDGGYSKPEDTIAIIDRCRFINCDCVDTIKTDVVYRSEVMNTKKTVKDVMRITNCEGVSSTDRFRKATPHFSDKIADIDLAKQSYGCSFLCSNQYLILKPATQEKIQSLISAYEHYIKISAPRIMYF